MPFSPERARELNPKVALEGRKPEEKLTWKLVEAEPTGYLDLRKVFQSDHISAYGLTFVYSPREQKVTCLTGSDDQLRVWINGELVQEYATNRGAAPDTDQVDVELKTGWNTVLVKVTNSVAAHGLYLRFKGGEGIRFSATKE